jgi:membrane protein DedA with SNARE-associated domain
MRRDEVFILGAMTGAVAVWWWGRKIEDRLAEKTRAVRTKAADGIQAVEETIRPA